MKENKSVVLAIGSAAESINGDVTQLFHVLREPGSAVAGIDRDGALRYHIGIGFKNPIRLDDALATATTLPEMPPQPGPTPVPDLVRNRW